MKYQSRIPQVAEAIEWTGENKEEVELFSGGKIVTVNSLLPTLLSFEDKSCRIGIGDYVVKDKERVKVIDGFGFTMLYEEIKANEIQQQNESMTNKEFAERMIAIFTENDIEEARKKADVLIREYLK